MSSYFSFKRIKMCIKKKKLFLRKALSPAGAKEVLQMNLVSIDSNCQIKNERSQLLIVVIRHLQ